MSTDINLLVGKDEESLKKQKRVKLYNFIAVLSLLVTGLISIVLFLLIQVTNTSLIKKEQDDILKKISQFKDKQTKLLILDNRINNIQIILDKRKDISHAMDSILTKIPSGLSLSSIEADDKSIVISADSSSLFTIGQFINNLTDMVRKKEIINSLTLNSLNFDEGKGSYQVSVKSEL